MGCADGLSFDCTPSRCISRRQQGARDVYWYRGQRSFLLAREEAGGVGLIEAKQNGIASDKGALRQHVGGQKRLDGGGQELCTCLSGHTALRQPWCLP
jgi:hypothetical protein